MKKTKTQKGITLVALIITIVVLLILAMVGIGAVRDSNIIAHAQNAASMYNQAKNNELAALAGYEDLMKGPIEYKVYGTEDFYVILSSENDILVFSEDKVQINTKINKKGIEEYLAELTQEEATEFRGLIESLESQSGANAKYFIFIEGMNDGYPLGGILENKIYFMNELLEQNEELAKSVVRRKGTYQCFGNIDGDGNAVIWDVNYNDNTCTMIWDISSSGILKRFKYEKNTVTQNNETITIYVNGEEVIIGTEAKKVETQMEGEDDLLVYYIQDSKLYMDSDMTSIGNGDTNGVAMPLVDHDLSKFGIIVIE